MISQAIRCQVEEEDVPPSDPQAAIRAAKYQVFIPPLLVSHSLYVTVY